MRFTDWPPETWIGLSTAVTVGLSGLIAAIVTARKGRRPQVEESFGPKPHMVRLSDEDRSLIGRAADELSDALRLHRDAVRDHRDAIRDLPARLGDRPQVD